MKIVKKYEGKKVLVLGLAKSGFNAAKLLKKLGAYVTVNDKQNFDDSVDAQKLLSEGIKVISGSHPLSLLDEGFTLIVKNPGIPYDNPIVKGALERKIPIITEIELASEVSEAQLVAVTGSNGKTTTTTMITKMLNQERTTGQSYDAGNIGIPASQVAQKVTKADSLVLEVSSFMLLGITQFHPHIAVLTNIFSNHLDYHKTRENYVRAKMRITMNQTDQDYFVVNFDNKEWRDLSKQTKAKVIPFSRLDVDETGAYEKSGKLYWRDDFIMMADEIKVPGDHNVENALAAIAVAKIEGKTNAAIKHVLTTFGGVRHRTQYVLTAEGRQYYNDSKATDIEATEMALKGFKQPVILLAGGLDRGYVFDKLVPSFKEHVKGIVLFGQTDKLLEDAAKKAGVKSIVFAKNVKDGVPKAFELSDSGDIILLSPANASWDQYPNFEVRGDEFIEAVEELTGEKEEK